MQLRYEIIARHAETGAAIPGAGVEIWDSEPHSATVRPAFRSGQTNADGQFTTQYTVFARVPPGPWDITVRITPPKGSGLKVWLYTPLELADHQNSDPRLRVIGESGSGFSYQLVAELEPDSGS
jgi:hypothetical protein